MHPDSSKEEEKHRQRELILKMKNDIIIAGVGGQGIVSIAAVIGLAAVEANLFLKQSEVHGMSQRGGDVQSHLRISDMPVASDLIPYCSADLIISVEPMEALRYLPWLSPDGWVVTNSTPFANINDYPDIEHITSELNKLKNIIIIDADSIAQTTGSPRTGNIVVLGAASSIINIPTELLEKGIADLFSKKGQEIIDVNLKAFRAGREFTSVRI